MGEKISIDKEIVLADRVGNLPESFIREILKVTTRPDIISFAGGLPNPDLFPVEQLQAACSKVLAEEGREALQYTVTEGFDPLRDTIAERYAEKGLHIERDNILIINGSQQGLDLTGKLLLNPFEKLMICRPTFIGALQSFSIFQPTYVSIDIYEDGPDLVQIEEGLKNNDVKFFYCVPNFQNPTGVTYSKEKRERIAEMIAETSTIILEDDPYNEIRFTDKTYPSFKELLPEQTILLGSFSKIIAPGLRTGWMAAPSSLIKKLVVLKQAADTHNNHFVQRTIYRFLKDFDIHDHINRIKNIYKDQRDLMIDCIKQHFPEDVKIFIPEGGMFIWATLPNNLSAYSVFDEAIKQKVAFVPGKTFYPELDVDNTFRLNFSNSNKEKIKTGIERLGKAIKSVL